MARHICDPHGKVSGKIQCDLSRTDGDGTVYSAQFRVLICPSCGQTEFFCESYQSVCKWLGGGSSEPPN